ncbi:RNA polymerase ii-associated protein [Anaeramoeba flamelloides]|uniref:RNA polymerase ii-associated protein n=1 Tax=Anaeramoeba flamelloides TaxID=1746091 RepID=A0ABQ8Z180_9EUKA|nr:RNA polymerase ii-associated protein [Anaeramoeba flamelloides]
MSVHPKLTNQTEEDLEKEQKLFYKQKKKPSVRAVRVKPKKSRFKKSLDIQNKKQNIDQQKQKEEEQQKPIVKDIVGLEEKMPTVLPNLDEYYLQKKYPKEKESEKKPTNTGEDARKRLALEETKLRLQYTGIIEHLHSDKKLFTAPKPRKTGFPPIIKRSEFRKRLEAKKKKERELQKQKEKQNQIQKNIDKKEKDQIIFKKKGIEIEIEKEKEEDQEKVEEKKKVKEIEKEKEKEKEKEEEEKEKQKEKTKQNIKKITLEDEFQIEMHENDEFNLWEREELGISRNEITEKEINKESDRLFNSMTEEERLETKEKLLRMLDPNIVETLKRLGKLKEQKRVELQKKEEEKDIKIKKIKKISFQKDILKEQDKRQEKETKQKKTEKEKEKKNEKEKENENENENEKEKEKQKQISNENKNENENYEEKWKKRIELMKLTNPLEKEKLKWTEDIEIKTQDKKKEKKTEYRFGFSGEILSQEKMNDQMEGGKGRGRGLFHHGLEPEKPGYSISELLILTRSRITSQRTLSFNILTQILKQCQINGNHKKKEYKYIIDHCFELGLGLVIKYSILYEENYTSLIASLETLHTIVVLKKRKKQNNIFLDSIGTTFKGYESLCMNPFNNEKKIEELEAKKKFEEEEGQPIDEELRNIFKEENEKFQDDEHQILVKDFSRGLIEGGLLERFMILLKKKKINKKFLIKKMILEILISLARNSDFVKEEIVKYTELINLFKEIISKKNEYKIIKLIWIISQYNSKYTLLLKKSGIFDITKRFFKPINNENEEMERKKKKGKGKRIKLEKENEKGKENKNEKKLENENENEKESKKENEKEKEKENEKENKEENKNNEENEIKNYKKCIKQSLILWRIVLCYGIDYEIFPNIYNEIINLLTGFEKNNRDLTFVPYIYNVFERLIHIAKSRKTTSLKWDHLIPLLDPAYTLLISIINNLNIKKNTSQNNNKEKETNNNNIDMENLTNNLIIIDSILQFLSSYYFSISEEGRLSNISLKEEILFYYEKYLKTIINSDFLKNLIYLYFNLKLNYEKNEFSFANYPQTLISDIDKGGISLIYTWSTFNGFFRLILGMKTNCPEIKNLIPKNIYKLINEFYLKINIDNNNNNDNNNNSNNNTEDKNESIKLLFRQRNFMIFYLQKFLILLNFTNLTNNIKLQIFKNSLILIDGFTIKDENYKIDLFKQIIFGEKFFSLIKTKINIKSPIKIETEFTIDTKINRLQLLNYYLKTFFPLVFDKQVQEREKEKEKGKKKKSKLIFLNFSPIQDNKFLISNDWMFFPIIRFDYYLEINFLKQILLFILFLEENEIIPKQINNCLKSLYTSFIFLKGSEIFLSPEINILLSTLWDNYHPNNAIYLISEYETAMRSSSIIMARSFEKLLLQFISAYSFESYGEPIFSDFIFSILCTSNPKTYKWRIFNELLEILNLIKPINNKLEDSLLNPPESNLEILRFMSQAISGKYLSLQRNQILFIYCLHHLNHFLFKTEFDFRKQVLLSNLLTNAPKLSVRHLLLYNPDFHLKYIGEIKNDHFSLENLSNEKKLKLQQISSTINQIKNFIKI